MEQNELQHYGVKGMKWGIHRAQKRLSKATTDADRDKAVASLNKHRTKASKKVAKLEKKHVGLEKAYDKAITKTDVKVAKLEQKKSKLERKATGLFTSDKKAAKLLGKAAVKDLKINKLKAESDRAKAEIAKNEHMQAAFKKGISDIDATLLASGRRYING